MPELLDHGCSYDRANGTRPIDRRDGHFSTNRSSLFGIRRRRFFVVSKASKETEGTWTLSGHVFVDSLPGEGERGAEVSERFELSVNGTALSSSETAGQTYFRCGKVRTDLHGAKEIMFFEKIKD
jgi:hypothetical protein